jgi:hypothetical protein
MEGKCGRITFDDRTFQKLIDGETLKLDVRPETVELEIKLDEDSRFRKRYVQLFEEALRRRGPLKGISRA